VSAPAADATTGLLRALRQAFIRDKFGKFIAVEEVHSREWASITFNGARHQITLRLEGEGAEAAADRFAAGLDAAEFRLRGHIVADLVLVGREPAGDGVRLRLEALTVEDV
jgi:hypothetical protein